MPIGLKELRDIDEVVGGIANAEPGGYNLRGSHRLHDQDLTVDEIGALAILKKVEKDRLQEGP